MNIALICDVYLPVVGGTTTVVMNLAEQFKKKGHNVLIITNKNQFCSSYEIIDEFEIYRLNLICPSFHPRSLFSLIIKGIPAAIDITKILREKKIDLINAHFATAPIFYANIAKFLMKPRIPVVATLHASDVYIFPKKSIGGLYTLKFNLWASNYIISNSNAVLNDAEKYYGKINQKASIIPNGVDLEEFNIKDKWESKCPYIFSLGRFNPVKGFDILINAFSFIADLYPELDLVIMGTGTEKNHYIQLIKKLELEDHIKVIEYTNRRAVIKLFNGCEFFVLPSRSEGMPLVNLEAMAAGKAVVTTNVGGISEVVKDKENGILVEPNIHSLKAGMLYLLKNERIREKISKNGKNYVENLTWDKIAERYLKVFEVVR